MDAAPVRTEPAMPLRTACLAFLAFALFALAQPAAKSPGYARPNLLLEPSDLLKPAKKFVILDARSKSKYLEGHVPGAIRVDVTAWARAFAAGQDRAAWSKRVGALGID